MRIESLTRLWVVVFVVAVAAAGCASEPDAEAEAEAQEDAAQLNFARCMREEGVDVPDPKPDDAGLSFARAPEGADQTAADAAKERCRVKLGDSLGPLADREDPQTHDDILAYARCMRESGIDMPDPDFSGPRSGPGIYFQKYSDYGDPEFEAADGPCRAKIFTREKGHDGGPNSGPGGEEKGPESPEPDAEEDSGD